MNAHRWGCLVGSLSLLLLSGCAAPETRRATTRVIANATPQETLDVARLLLEREFERVTVDSAAGVILADPVEFSATRDTGTLQDVVGAPTRLRRLARFEIAQARQGEPVARLRIDVERLDTSRRAIFAADQHRISDLPGTTPVDDDAASTTEQYAVWTPLRRDSALERALLDELQDQFAEASGRPEQEPSAVSP